MTTMTDEQLAAIREWLQQASEPCDGWLAECAENWWVHQRGSTDTNRSRWALQYADRLIAAAKENATFQDAIDAVEWRGKYEKERERNSRLERSNASNLKACDELKAKLEQTTALLIAECDETVRLRAELTTAKAKLDAECVAATIETLAAQREVVNGRGWLARAENELDACFVDAAPLDQAYAWCDNWAYALIEEVKQLSRERVDMGELCGDARIGRMVRDLLKWGGGHMPISSLEAMTHD